MDRDRLRRLAADAEPEIRWLVGRILESYARSNRRGKDVLASKLFASLADPRIAMPSDGESDVEVGEQEGYSGGGSSGNSTTFDCPSCGAELEVTVK